MIGLDNAESLGQLNGRGLAAGLLNHCNRTWAMLDIDRAVITVIVMISVVRAIDRLVAMKGGCLAGEQGLNDFLAATRIERDGLIVITKGALGTGLIERELALEGVCFGVFAFIHWPSSKRLGCAVRRYGMRQ